MICKNCGKKIRNGMDVCSECGESLCPNVPQANAKSIILKEETDHAIIWYIKKKAVYMTAAVLIILVVGLNLLMAALSFFNRIDFTKYVLVEAAGYDGRGTINVQIDSDGLSRKLFGKTPDELEVTEQRRLATVVNLLQNDIEIEGAAFGCSNGDEVVLRISDLKALSEAAGQECKSSDKIVYMVKDLKEASTLAFEDLFDVSFAGFNGAGCVLVTPKADAPWDTACYYNEVYFDGYTYYIYYQDGEAGALSNEDTISIGLTPEWEDNSEYLLDAYGMYVSDEPASYTVSGLSEPQSVDVMSMVEITLKGTEGSIEVGYRWSQEEYQQENVRIVPRDGQSNSFNITVNGVPANDAGIIALTEGEVLSTTEQDLGWFYINADKNENISAGDAVNISIQSDWFDQLDHSDVLAPYGVRFTSISKTITVDESMIPRRVTSFDQVNSENLGVLAWSLTVPVKETLEKDWSRIVHGNANYVCYDQAVTAGPMITETRLVCTDVNSNSYAVWVIYAIRVTDSELEGEQIVYAAVRLNDPIVFRDESNTVSYSGGMQMEFGRDPGFVYNSWWYRNENSVAYSY